MNIADPAGTLRTIPSVPLALDILNNSGVDIVLGGIIGGIGGMRTKRYDAQKIEAEARREREKREWDEKLSREVREREAATARDETIRRFLETDTDLREHFYMMQDADDARARMASRLVNIQLLGDAPLYAAAKALAYAPNEGADDARAAFIAAARVTH